MKKRYDLIPGKDYSPSIHLAFNGNLQPRTSLTGESRQQSLSFPLPPLSTDIRNSHSWGRVPSKRIA
jgi:hypothetical protein